MVKIYFITDNQFFYGQKLFPWESIDSSKIISVLEESFEVEHVTFEQIANSDIDISKSYVLYSSSQKEEYKEFIGDILTYLNCKENVLIPSLNVFKSHDNKGYQELHKKLLGIKSIPCLYFGHHKELNDDECKYPAVMKLLDGACSGGVSLVENKYDVVKLSTSNDCLVSKGTLRKIKSSIVKPVKKLLGMKVSRNDFGDYFDYFKRFVIQKFIPDMKHDFKVLVFDKKYYVLKRFTRDSDFRASGSGKFVYEKPDDSLLDYASELFEKFNEPFMAFDICFDGNEYHLIEFQGTHFGPYTLMESEGYYHKNEGKWDYVESKTELDEETAYALLNYIKKIISGETNKCA